MPDAAPEIPQETKERIAGIWADAFAEAQNYDFDAASMWASQAKEEWEVAALPTEEGSDG